MKAFARKQLLNNALIRRNFKSYLSPIPEVKTLPAFSTSHKEIQRKPACPCGGDCPRCKGDHAVQTRLKVNEPGDKYEQEADRVAEAVVGSKTSHVLQRKCACEGACDRCRSEGTLQQDDVTQHILSRKGAGQMLESDAQAFAETHFGGHFDDVRIHTDTHAAETAHELNALAYTVGRDIFFAAGQYRPHTGEGKRLLAHELTHVVQQSGSSFGALPQRLIIQRQSDDPLIPIPVFDELDICIEFEGRQVCGSDAKKLCEKVPSIPGCGIFKKKGKKEEKKVICPPGFTPGAAKGFEGTCCKGSVHNERDCCTPDRIVVNAFSPRCCPAGTEPDAERKNCVTPPPTPVLPPCPPDQTALLSTCLCFPPERQNFLKGVCCPEGQTPGLSGECETAPPPKPPVPPPKPSISAVEVFFHKDKPAAGASGSKALGSSLTDKGKSNFTELVKQLRGDPSLKVQLVGRASPEGGEEYNLDLGRRRAELIAQALKDEGIDFTRIADPPENKLRSECQEVRQGVFTCGEAGATGDNDRQVLARVFAST